MPMLDLWNIQPTSKLASKKMHTCICICRESTHSTV